jgi:transposase
MVEAIRVLLVAKRSARSVRVKTIVQMRHLTFTAPEQLREQLKSDSALMLARHAAGLRPRPDADPVVFATKTALRILGRRVVALDAELEHIDELLDELVSQVAPRLLAVYGVGVHTAATLLAAAGDNPQRLRSEAAWAHLCGAAPIQASSGKVARHRLDRGGDRQANSALWTIVMVRMVSHQPTRDYVARRTAEGRSKSEIIRILKRYVAREVYHYLPRG